MFKSLTVSNNHHLFRESIKFFFFFLNLGSLNPENPVQVSINQLTAAIYDLLRLHANSGRSPTDCAQSSKSAKEAWTTTEQLQFTIFAAHGISSNWVSK